MRSFIILILVCFVTGQEKRAVNGIIGITTYVTIDEYPYQVSLQLYSTHICGGSIISDSWVLTACSCIEDVRKPWHLSIRAGSTFHNAGGKTYTVRKMIIHPRCLNYTCDYDIALLEVKNTIIHKDTVVIRLPPQGTSPPAGSVATITGWGASIPGVRSLRNLHMVQVPTMDQKECRNAFHYKSHEITDRMICAGRQSGGDSCQGEPGGPLVIGGIQYGIVSWGLGCSIPIYPGVYTNIAALRSWIREESGV